MACANLEYHTKLGQATAENQDEALTTRQLFLMQPIFAQRTMNEQQQQPRQPRKHPQAPRQSTQHRRKQKQPQQQQPTLTYDHHHRHDHNTTRRWDPTRLHQQQHRKTVNHDNETDAPHAKQRHRLEDQKWNGLVSTLATPCVSYDIMTNRWCDGPFDDFTSDGGTLPPIDFVSC